MFYACSTDKPPPEVKTQEILFEFRRSGTRGKIPECKEWHWYCACPIETGSAPWSPGKVSKLGDCPILVIGFPVLGQDMATPRQNRQPREQKANKSTDFPQESRNLTRNNLSDLVGLHNSKPPFPYLVFRREIDLQPTWSWLARSSPKLGAEHWWVFVAYQFWALIPAAHRKSKRKTQSSCGVYLLEVRPESGGLR